MPIDLLHDPRIGHAGKTYTYCRRCGTLFHKPTDADFHFGEKKWTSGGTKGQECCRIPCSGKPTGKPQENPAPGHKCSNLAEQEARGAKSRAR